MSPALSAIFDRVRESADFMPKWQVRILSADLCFQMSANKEVGFIIFFVFIFSIREPKFEALKFTPLRIFSATYSSLFFPKQNAM